MRSTLFAITLATAALVGCGPKLRSATNAPSRAAVEADGLPETSWSWAKIDRFERRLSAGAAAMPQADYDQTRARLAAVREFKAKPPVPLARELSEQRNTAAAISVGLLAARARPTPANVYAVFHQVERLKLINARLARAQGLGVQGIDGRMMARAMEFVPTAETEIRAIHTN